MKNTIVIDTTNNCQCDLLSNSNDGSNSIALEINADISKNPYIEINSTNVPITSYRFLYTIPSSLYVGTGILQFRIVDDVSAGEYFQISKAQSLAGNLILKKNSNFSYSLRPVATAAVLLMYPVGSIYQTMDTDFNPNITWGGTWERIKGRVLVGVDESQTEFATVGKEGGNKYLQHHSHTLSGTAVSAGAHAHTLYCKTKAAKGSTYRTVGIASDYDIARSTGSAGAHAHTLSGTAVATGSGDAQNLQPYVTCYIWERIA